MPRSRRQAQCIQLSNIEILPSSFSAETLERLGLGKTLRSNQADMAALHHQIVAGIEQCARDLDDQALHANPVQQASLRKLKAALADLHTVADGFFDVIRQGDEKPPDK